MSRWLQRSSTMFLSRSIIHRGFSKQYSCNAKRVSEPGTPSMGVPAYLRYLARLAGRQLRLRTPSDGRLSLAGPADLPGLLPYTHPISGHRNRSFEDRHLQLWVANLRHPRPPQLQQQQHGQPEPGHSTEPAQAAPHAAPVSVAPDVGSHENGSNGVSSNVGGVTNSLTAQSGAGGRDRELEPAGAAAAGAAASDAAPQGRRRSLHLHVNPHPHPHLHLPYRPAHPHPHQPHNPSSHTPPQDASQPNPQHPESQPGQQQSVDASLQPQQPHRPPLLFRVNPPSTPHPHIHSHSHHHHHHHPARSPPLLEIYYPFASHPDLWKQYLSPSQPEQQQQLQDDVSRPMGHCLDPGPWIEDFDTFAADVAARHVGHIPDSMLVTASMERLTWHVHTPPMQGGAGEAGIAQAG
ncbi:hypothetical protein Agub_g10854, partial [Astrephomene gubernaculifera]